MVKATTIKVSKETRDALKVISKGMPFEETIKGLLTRPEPINEFVGLKNHEFKETEVKRDFFKCPKCGNETLGLFGTVLNFYVKEYFMTPGELTKKELSEAIDNLKGIGLVPKHIDKEKILAEIDASRSSGEKHFLEFGGTTSNKSICSILRSYKDLSLSSCSCGYINNSKTWKTVKSKKVKATICPYCNNKVEHVPENYSITRRNAKILICSNCSKYQGSFFEILNALGYNQGGFPLSVFDHVKIYPDKNLITSEPYHCSGEDLYKLLQAANILGYAIFLSGNSQHNPDGCFTINISKVKKEA